MRRVLSCVLGFAAVACDDAPPSPADAAIDAAPIDMRPVDMRVVDMAPEPDMRVLDMAPEPDMRVIVDMAPEPDMRVVDMTPEPDMRVVDMAPEHDMDVIDMAPDPDMRVIVDMAPDPDMRVIVDMAPEPDMRVIVDMAPDPDMRVIVDMAPDPDAAPIDEGVEPLPAVFVACNPDPGSIGVRLRIPAGTAYTGVELVLRGENGDPLPFADGERRLVVAADRLAPDGDALRFSAFVASDLFGMQGVDVALLDGLDRQAFGQADCTPPIEIAPGDACDPARAFTLCPAEHACAGQADPTCQVAERPRVIDGLARLANTTRTLGLALTLGDDDGDVVAVGLQLLDAQRAVLRDARGIGIPEVFSAAIQAEPGAFNVRIVERLPDAWGDLGRARFARVSAIDSAGQRSGDATLVIDTPLAVPPGASCDVTEVFTACPPEQLCGFAGGNPRGDALCQASFAVCPEAFAAIEAEVGQTPIELADGLGIAGTCTAGLSQAVARFVPPAPGAWRIRTDAPETRVLVRRLCAFPQPRFELGCGAEVHLDVGSVDPVWIVVDGPAGATNLIVEEVQ